MTQSQTMTTLKLPENKSFNTLETRFNVYKYSLNKDDATKGRPTEIMFVKQADLIGQRGAVFTTMMTDTLVQCLQKLPDNLEFNRVLFSFKPHGLDQQMTMYMHLAKTITPKPDKGPGHDIVASIPIANDEAVTPTDIEPSFSALLGGIFEWFKHVAGLGNKGNFGANRNFTKNPWFDELTLALAFYKTYFPSLTLPMWIYNLISIGESVNIYIMIAQFTGVTLMQQSTLNLIANETAVKPNNYSYVDKITKERVEAVDYRLSTVTILGSKINFRVNYVMNEPVIRTESATVYHVFATD